MGSITSRCSGNELTLTHEKTLLFSGRKAGPEGAAEIEPMITIDDYGLTTKNYWSTKALGYGIGAFRYTKIQSFKILLLISIVSSGTS